MGEAELLGPLRQSPRVAGDRDADPEIDGCLHFRLTSRRWRLTIRCLRARDDGDAPALRYSLSSARTSKLPWTGDTGPDWPAEAQLDAGRNPATEFLDTAKGGRCEGGNTRDGNR